jgi:hypothetical protein
MTLGRDAVAFLLRGAIVRASKKPEAPFLSMAFSERLAKSSNAKAPKLDEAADLRCEILLVPAREPEQ